MSETNTTANHAAPYRTFIDAIKVCFAKYATFKGRASRSEFWWFFLFIVLGSVLLVLPGSYVALFVANALGNHDLPLNVLVIIISLWSGVILLPYFSVNVRRLHDIGRSGWWILLAVPADIVSVLAPKISPELLEVYDMALALVSSPELVEWHDLVHVLSVIFAIPLFVMLCFRGKSNPAT